MIQCHFIRIYYVMSHTLSWQNFSTPSLFQSQGVSAVPPFAYYRQQLSIFMNGSLFRLAFSRSSHEGITSSFVGNRRTDSAFSLFLSPLLRIRPLLHARWTSPTNFLLRSFVSISSAVVLTSSRPHVRYHVKITFDLLLSRERKREGERERDRLKRTRTSKLYVTDSILCSSCFVRNERRCAGESADKTQRRFITPRLSGCQFRFGDGSNVVFRVAVCHGECFCRRDLSARENGCRYTAFSRAI